MFTGIIEATAVVGGHTKNKETLVLSIEKPPAWELAIGQSIAVNGACLTVVAYDEKTFTVELMSETLDKTIFGQCLPETVNLERAMLATDRFEGHVVQGHVDTMGEVAALAIGDSRHELTISFDSQFDDLVVEKGSITINGVSLTVLETKSGSLSVALIPHTLKETTLSDLKVGDAVNLEFDIMGKYLMNKK